MSRLIKKPIAVPEGVTVQRDGNLLLVRGPLGENKLGLEAEVELRIEPGNVWVEPSPRAKRGAILGTTWALVRNAVEGVTKGFVKVLEVEGVGFRVSLKDENLVLSLGYAEPIRFHVPEGVAVAVEKNTIKISGSDKSLVGEVAARVRALKKPEPYKGKGIRYRGEVIRRKVGKKAATAAK